MLLSAACPKGGGDDTGPEGVTGTTESSTGAQVTSGEQVTSTGGSTSGEPQGPPMYCPGVPKWSYPLCRQQEDCDGEGFPMCRPVPDDCPGPGCQSDCGVDADCFEEGFPPFVCAFLESGCCAATSGTCIPACTPGSCAVDESCAADGHCVPLSCGDTFTCPEGQKCELGAGADRHGCRPIACDQPGALACPQVTECVGGECTRRVCSVDADCPCGTCILGGCWDRPWICAEDNR